ncbi:unnamed protein product [Rodentolepis nana]|uniref:Transmembrane protein n=1 Tax=Rodentolepis nana TaxID=102285 RepID=A0A0R3TD50_RODNA|nr:unnamed protein product [Rodentolepis nana]
MQVARNPGKTKYCYACYTSTDSVHGLEDCEMESWRNALMSLGWVIYLNLAYLAFSFLITVCIVLASSISVFGSSTATQLTQQRQHSVLYTGGGNLDPSMKVFEEVPSLVATNPSLFHSLVPSLAIKPSASRPQHDSDKLPLDEVKNADEFSGPL